MNFPSAHGLPLAISDILFLSAMLMPSFPAFTRVVTTLPGVQPEVEFAASKAGFTSPLHARRLPPALSKTQSCVVPLRETDCSPRANIPLPRDNVSLPCVNIRFPQANVLLPRANIQLPCAHFTFPHANIHLPCANIHLPCANIHLPRAKVCLPHAKVCFSCAHVPLPCAKAHLLC